jgi:hypothetical protein
MLRQLATLADLIWAPVMKGGRMLKRFTRQQLDGTALPLGIECNRSALVLRVKCRVDTWEYATVKRIATFDRLNRMATAWQRKGLYVAHAVSDLCRMFHTVGDSGFVAPKSYSVNEFSAF